ncbi:MAG: ribosome-associated translation inhibitor RaiA [Deltaproteobacteria bacterium]|nr:ribosome-associated translation inhibitor RaiA [Deltaproteobacteria bacterium]
MNLRFKGMESTDALKDYFKERIAKVKKHVPVNTVMNVTLAKEKVQGQVEVSFRYNGKSIVAAERSEDMYNAIDTVVDKISRQVAKAKERARSRTSNTIREISTS